MPGPPKRTGLSVTLIVLTAVLVLGFIGGAVWAVDRITSTRTVAAGSTNSAGPSPAATTPSSVPSTSATTQAPSGSNPAVTLVTPTAIGGQPKITDPNLQKYADQADQALQNQPGATSTVAAFYGKSTDVSTLFGVVGAAAPFSDPKAAVQASFAGYGTITNVSSVDPGPLGGYAQCGKTTQSGTSLAVCGWGDDGSLVIVMAFGRTPAQCGDLMRTVRTQVEKRN
jgi:cytoskeletal protein RodZ